MIGESLFHQVSTPDVLAVRGIFIYFFEAEASLSQCLARTESSSPDGFDSFEYRVLEEQLGR